MKMDISHLLDIYEEKVGTIERANFENLLNRGYQPKKEMTAKEKREIENKKAIEMHKTGVSWLKVATNLDLPYSTLTGRMKKIGAM